MRNRYNDNVTGLGDGLNLVDEVKIKARHRILFNLRGSSSFPLASLAT